MMGICFNDDDKPPKVKVKIGIAWRDSQTMRDNATPRTMSPWVPDQGPHADRVQRALLLREREDRMVLRAALSIGAALAIAAVLGVL
jgi:hypothetical protein